MQRLCFARLFYLQPKYAGQFLHSFIKYPVALIPIIRRCVPSTSCVVSKTCGLFQYWMKPLALWRRRPRVSSIRPVNSWEWPSSVWVTVALWKRCWSMTFSHSLNMANIIVWPVLRILSLFFKQHHDIMLRLCGGGQWELTKLKEAWTSNLPAIMRKYWSVLWSFSLETLEKSCLLYSILRFTEVIDTLIMQYESFCYCLSQCTFHIAIYIFFYYASICCFSQLYCFFLPNGSAQKGII